MYKLAHSWFQHASQRYPGDSVPLDVAHYKLWRVYSTYLSTFPYIKMKEPPKTLSQLIPASFFSMILLHPLLKMWIWFLFLYQVDYVVFYLNIGKTKQIVYANGKYSYVSEVVLKMAYFFVGLNSIFKRTLCCPIHFLPYQIVHFIS